MKTIARTGKFLTRTVIAIAVSIAVLAGTAFALYSSGYDTIPFVPLSDNDGHTTIQPISHSDPELDAAWKKAQREAVDMWNASSDEIHITITDDSPNTIEFRALPGTARGFYVPTLTCLYSECEYSIYIRDEFYTDYNPYHIKWRGRHIIAHELGHALGLNDFQHREIESIMNYQWKHVSRQPSTTDVHHVESRIQIFRTITSLNPTR